MPSRSFSSEKSYSPRLSETAERVLSGRIHQIRMQGDCPAGKPRGRDAGGVQDSEAAHLNSLKRALESQISMSHLVPLLEFDHNGARRRLRLHEKGGKEHEMPVHHLLEQILNEYIAAAGLQNGEPLFPER